MKVKYIPNSRVYYDYFNHQVGHGFPIFIGGSQRGNGLGSVLSGLFRSAIPLLKKGGKALLKEGLASGVNIANNVLDGQSFGKAFQKETKRAGKNIMKRAIGHFKQAAPPGQPLQKKRRTMTKKKKRKDIFD